MQTRRGIKISRDKKQPRSLPSSFDKFSETTLFVQVISFVTLSFYEDCIFIWQHKEISLFCRQASVTTCHCWNCLQGSCLAALGPIHLDRLVDLPRKKKQIFMDIFNLNLNVIKMWRELYKICHHSVNCVILGLLYLNFSDS